MNVIDSVFKSIKDLVDMYFSSLKNDPVKVFTLIVIVLIILYISYKLVDKWNAYIVKRKKDRLDPETKQLYDSWDLLNKAYHLLELASNNLKYEDSKVEPLIIGAVTIGWPKAKVYPNPKASKEALHEVIALLSGKGFGLHLLEEIEKKLPDDENLTEYNNEAVDRDTFDEERLHISVAVDGICTREMQILSQLPAEDTDFEKRVSLVQWMLITSFAGTVTLGLFSLLFLLIVLYK